MSDRSHKLRECVNTLVELGFPTETAHKAARATGADVQAATELLLAGARRYRDDLIVLAASVFPLSRGSIGS